MTTMNISPHIRTTSNFFQHTRLPKQEGLSSSSAPSRNSKETLEPFPLLLYDMLEDTGKHGFDDIVSWHPQGTSFRVHRPDAFMQSILPKYFKQQTRYKSFKRQLNLYGFRVNKTGDQKGFFAQKEFRRGDRALCSSIARKKASTTTAPKSHRKPSTSPMKEEDLFVPDGGDDDSAETMISTALRKEDPQESPRRSFLSSWTPPSRVDSRVTSADLNLSPMLSPGMTDPLQAAPQSTKRGAQAHHESREAAKPLKRDQDEDKNMMKPYNLTAVAALRTKFSNENREEHGRDDKHALRSGQRLAGPQLLIDPRTIIADHDIVDEIISTFIPSKV